ncbi:unnamed protein product [Trichogramma brassicae]|uniref:Uncharacterized protein n=1 Tax=Trichogramma brassicae TaxID=86971 RepID=A0A6H5IV81_9HYME|nr:unnamed protein product [Trichogramma brassicae]
MSPPLDFAGRHALICSVTMFQQLRKAPLSLSVVSSLKLPAFTILQVGSHRSLSAQKYYSNIYGFKAIIGTNWPMLPLQRRGLNSGASCLRCKLCKYLVGSVLSSIHLSSYMDFRMLLNEHTLLSSILSDKTVRT